MATLSLVETDKRKCQICAAPSKYCCPKCLMRTCSLKCVQTHKNRTNCDGIRDKTAYIKLDKFTDLDLLSDYRFLEEASRITDNAFRSKRNPIGRGFTTHKLPYWLHRLQVEARLRGTALRFLPTSFEKRKHNSSTFRQKGRLIFWKVEWIFPLADLKFTDDRVCEKMTVAEALLKHLDTKGMNTDTQQRMASYLGNGMNGICILLKVESRPANSPCFYELDLSLSLKDNLRDKLIIEYPIFHVIPKHHLHSYPLVEEEESTQPTEISEPEERKVTKDNSDHILSV